MGPGRYHILPVTVRGLGIGLVGLRGQVAATVARAAPGSKDVGSVPAIGQQLARVSVMGVETGPNPRAWAPVVARSIDSLQDKRRPVNQHQIASTNGHNSAFHGPAGLLTKALRGAYVIRQRV